MLLVTVDLMPIPAHPLVDVIAVLMYLLKHLVPEQVLAELVVAVLLSHVQQLVIVHLLEILAIVLQILQYLHVNAVQQMLAPTVIFLNALARFVNVELPPTVLVQIQNAKPT